MPFKLNATFQHTMCAVVSYSLAKEGEPAPAIVCNSKQLKTSTFQHTMSAVFSYSLAKEGEAERTVFQSVALGNTGR